MFLVHSQVLPLLNVVEFFPYFFYPGQVPVVFFFNCIQSLKTYFLWFPLRYDR